MTTKRTTSDSDRLWEGSPLTERRLDLAGVRTVVAEGGDGPSIVLLHGQGGFGAMWAPVASALAGRHRVVVPDLPGLGASEVTTGSLDTTGVVAWLGELIRQTCTEPPVLVGSSLGGSIALHFALAHPEQVGRVVLVDSGSLGRFRPAPAALLALIRYLRRPSVERLHRFARYAFADPEGVRARGGARLAALDAYHVDRAKQPTVRAANRKLLRSVGVRRIAPDRLRGISVPVAMIWGRQDRIMRVRIAEDASRTYGWPLYPIDECGHVPMAEQPAAFGEALRRVIEP